MLDTAINKTRCFVHFRQINDGFGPDHCFSHLRQFLRQSGDERTHWGTCRARAQKSAAAGVMMSAVEGTAVLRICDFSGQAGARPLVRSLCVAPVEIDDGQYPRDFRNGSSLPAFCGIPLARSSSDC
jgi:hypothetical protein